MQVTIELPPKLTERIVHEWDDLPKRLLASLLLSAFRERLISFAELKEMLNFDNEADLDNFLKQEQILHSGGLLNLYGVCSDIELMVDDAGIDENLDDQWEDVNHE